MEQQRPEASWSQIVELDDILIFNDAIPNYHHYPLSFFLQVFCSRSLHFQLQDADRRSPGLSIIFTFQGYLS